MLAAPPASTMAANSADSSPEMYRTACPYCNKQLKIPLNLLDRKLKCPSCSEPIRFMVSDHIELSKPPVLAETLPHTKPPQTNLEDGLDYLSDYEPAGPGIRFLAACGDMLAFAVIGNVLLLVCMLAVLIAFKFTSYGPLVSFDAYTSLSGFFSALIHTSWNLFTGGGIGVWIDALIVMVPYAGGMAIMGYGLWYFSCKLLTTSWQATIGKKMLGLIVVDESGQPVTSGQATARWFYRLVGTCCFYLGFLGIQKSPYQTWYDRMAKTQVLRRRQEYHA